MSTNIIVLSGNLTADPETRFTASGAAVVSFTVAHTERKMDKDTNQWVDGDTLFMRCSVWRKQAENFAESALKGDAVLVTGKLKQRSYETKEGEKRTVVELEVETVALSVARGPVHPVRNAKTAAPARSDADDAWGNDAAPF